MNKKQRRLTWVCLVIFALTLLAAPVTYSVHYSTYIPVFAVGPEHQIRFDALAMEWVGLAVLYAGIFLLFRSRKHEPS